MLYRACAVELDDCNVAAAMNSGYDRQLVGQLACCNDASTAYPRRWHDYLETKRQQDWLLTYSVVEKKSSSCESLIREKMAAVSERVVFQTEGYLIVKVSICQSWDVRSNT